MNIGVLLASLIVGAGLEPNIEPRPVVKQIRFAPLAIWPVDGHRVVARRVHEHEAGLVDRLGVFVHRLQRRGAALHRRAERLLEDVGQAAGLVARADDAVELAVVAARVLLPPGEAVEQLLADLRA